MNTMNNQKTQTNEGYDYQAKFLLRTIKTWIDLEAPQTAVWQALVDFDNWPKWNSFIPHAEGELKKGALVKIEVIPPGLKKMIFTSRVFEIQELREFTWGGGFLGFVYKGVHSFILEKLSDNLTRFTQIEHFQGPLVLFMGSMMEPTKNGYLNMNKNLKGYLEQADQGSL